MRNDGDTIESAHGEQGAEASVSSEDVSRASGAIRRARGATKRKSAAADASPKVLRASKGKVRSLEKTARSRGDGGKKAEHASRVASSPAAQSVPSMKLAFADRPTPTEPGEELDETSVEASAASAHEASLDEDAEVFFKGAEPSAANDHAGARGTESLAPMEHDVREVSPHVHLRRAKLAKYVRAAMAVSAALCLAAVVRGAVAKVTHEHEATAHAMTSDVGRVVAHQGPHEETPIAPPAAAPIVSAQVDVAPAKSAAEEKKSTRIALERGKLKDAIAAGERSIALDPSDGEAWLLLGAAYQDSGKSSDARRCFIECTKQGERGPINECRMMLR